MLTFLYSSCFGVTFGKCAIGIAGGIEVGREGDGLISSGTAGNWGGDRGCS